MRVVSRRRLLSTTFGVILSVAIIFSMFTLGNNYSKLSLYESIENSSHMIEAVAEISPRNFTSMISSLERVDHVTGVDAYLFTSVNIPGNEPYETTSLMVSYWKNFENDISLISGRLPERTYEIAIDEYEAEILNVSLGNNLNCTVPSANGVKNITLSIVGIYNLKNPIYPSGGIATLDTIGKITYGTATAIAMIKVDTDYLLSSSDINEVQKKLWSVKEDVNFVLSKYSVFRDVRVTFNYYPDMVGMLTALTLSLPIIAMGAYLTMVSIEIELTERRRELGILKIRGAGEWQRFKMIFYESIIYAIFGGVAGYILGEVIALIINDTMFHIPFFTLDIGYNFLLASIITSFVLFFAALYKPWKKIKETPIVELISHYSQRFKEVEYRAGRDIVLSIIFWSLIISSLYLSRSVSFEGGLNIIVILAIIVMALINFLFPFILIILPLSMARLLTLGTQRFYRIIASGIARLSGTSGELVKKGISRNPKNIAYIAFILAFILTYSSFISCMNDNTEVMSDINSVQYVGGDFYLDTYQQVKLSPELLEEIANSKNQSAHCFLESVPATLYQEYTNVYFANYLNYTRSVYYLDIFIKDGKISRGSAIISEYLANRYSLQVGDKITVEIENSSGANEMVRYRIGAIAYSIPGIHDSSGILIDGKVDVENATALILKAKNYEKMKKELVNYGIEFEERKMNEENYGMMFITTAEIFMVILGSATIFIIQYSLYLNRRGEITLYKVRGATMGQVSKVLMIEGTTVILLAMAIGIAVGLSLAYSWISMEQSMTHIPPFFVLGENLLVITLVMLLLFLLSQYIVSLIFARVRASEIIRSLGGEM